MLIRGVRLTLIKTTLYWPFYLFHVIICNTQKGCLKAENFSNFLSDGWLVGGRGGGDALDKKPHPVK